MKLIGILSEEVNKKRLLKLLTTDMGMDKSDAEKELEYYLEKVKNLPDELTLYRVLNVDKKEDINKEQLGSHYSDKKKDLMSSHYFVDGGEENYFLVTVKAKKSMVDIMATLENNILYPNENEVTLKNKGKGVDIISIRKIAKK
jgi:hypothetical protein